MKQIMIAGAAALILAVPALAQLPQGPISRADFLAQSRAHFADLDTNHDGALTKDELSAALAKQFGGTPPAEIVDKIFAALDTNGDGKATTAEIDTHATERFNQWDTNHDGTLTPEEIMAGQQAMMAAQKPQ
jgi:Ca2+-binding EF-hand superfamily protein